MAERVNRRREELAMRHLLPHATMPCGRRSFLLGTAGTLATGLSVALARPQISDAPDIVQEAR